MLTENKPAYTTYTNGWIVRIRPPADPASARVLLLIHGWTGDEKSMWVFARNIPDHYAIIAPRGPVAGEDGFGWADISKGQDATLDDYAKVGENLLEQLDSWISALHIDPQQSIDLMGFSQGTAMCYSLAIAYPERVRKIAGLSGFLPAGADEALTPGLLNGKEVFVAHGTEDEVVPLERGRRVVEAFQRAGATVHYCEEETGHRLGSACFRGLAEFFN